MMDTQSIHEKVIELFCDVMDTDTDAVSPSSTAEDVEGWDSVSHVRLIMSAEKQFGIKFTNKEIGGFTCLGDMLDAVSSKLNS